MKKKITVIGPSGVGKTNLIYKLLNLKVPKILPITLCIDYITNKLDNLTFIDYTGNKKIFSCFFNQITDTDLLIMVLNDTLEHLLQEFNYYQLHNLYKFPIIVVFNNNNNNNNSNNSDNGIDNTDIPNPLKTHFQDNNINYFCVNCKTGLGISTLKKYLEHKL